MHFYNPTPPTFAGVYCVVLCCLVVSPGLLQAIRHQSKSNSRGDRWAEDMQCIYTHYTVYAYYNPTPRAFRPR